MNELVALIVKKTGIPEATATTIVTIMLNYVTKKLPAPIASEVSALLNNEAAVQEAEQILGGLGGLVSAFEKDAQTKKKK
jgi:hypothetical protein